MAGGCSHGGLCAAGVNAWMAHGGSLAHTMVLRNVMVHTMVLCSVVRSREVVGEWWRPRR